MSHIVILCTANTNNCWETNTPQNFFGYFYIPNTLNTHHPTTWIRDYQSIITAIQSLTTCYGCTTEQQNTSSRCRYNKTTHRTADRPSVDHSSARQIQNSGRGHPLNPPTIAPASSPGLPYRRRQLHYPIKK